MIYELILFLEFSFLLETGFLLLVAQQKNNYGDLK